MSRLHGQVSRRIFQRLFPGWPEAEIPVGHITNGVHVPSWDSAEADQVWTSYCGKERWRGSMESVTDIRQVSDSALWQLRTTTRRGLIQYARERLALQLAAAGVPLSEVRQAQQFLDPHALTIGFARRFAQYKRPNLLLHDPDRLTRILTNPHSPAQLIIAGKAHPQDRQGQAMVQAWVRFIRERPEVRRHAIFLSDYDMSLAEQLVQGVDLWINTPRRPWEACGTSGMKVLVNGGLNLSELDGWWAEAYTPEVGWALGDGREHGDDPGWDTAEAEALYTLLEQEVIPAFYTRDDDGIPTAWVTRVRESMARLTPRFSANRTVREYTEKYYLSAAAAYRKRSADQGALGVKILCWRHTVAQHWAMVHFGPLQVETVGDQHMFQLPVYLNEMVSETVRVELYADALNGKAPEHHAMRRGAQLVGAAHGYVYSAQVPSSRPATDYTPRIIPSHPDAMVPLEASQILWQR